MLTSRRLMLTLLPTVAASLLALPAPVMAAAFPPQMPSPEETARLQAQASSSLGRLSAAQKELDRLVASFEAAQTTLESLSGEVSAAESRYAVLEGQLTDVQKSINARAASNYRFGPTVLLNVLLGARDFRQLGTAVDLFESVTNSDRRTLNDVKQVREETARLKTALDAKRVEQQKAVNQLKQRQGQMQGSLAELGRQYESVKDRLETSKSGFAFPVKAPYSFVDTWGAPRPGYRKHQGTDIFAVYGTPVLAVVDGIIEDKAVTAIGGNKLWVRSPGDGWRYYYAHMAGYAPGITNGTRVKRGQTIGYIGTSGNAAGTPPHVHFETHVGGGAATNPYPILKRVNLLK